MVNLNERVKSQFGEEYGVMIENNPGEGVLLKIYIPDTCVLGIKGNENADI